MNRTPRRPLTLAHLVAAALWLAAAPFLLAHVGPFFGAAILWLCLQAAGLLLDARTKRRSQWAAIEARHATDRFLGQGRG